MSRDESTQRDCEAVAAFVRVLAYPLGRAIAEELRTVVAESLAQIARQTPAAQTEKAACDELRRQLEIVTAQRDDLAKDLEAAQRKIEDVPSSAPPSGSKTRVGAREVMKTTTTRTCQTCVHWNTQICRNEASPYHALQVGAGNTCDQHVFRPIAKTPAWHKAGEPRRAQCPHCHAMVPLTVAGGLWPHDTDGVAYIAGRGDRDKQCSGSGLGMLGIEQRQR